MRKSEAVEVSKETAKLREKQKYLEKQLIRIREKKKGKRERKFKNSFVAEGIHNSTPKLAKDKSS